METASRNWRILRNMNASKDFFLLPVLWVGLISIFITGCGDHQETFYPPSPTRTKQRRFRTAGYQTIYFPLVLGPFIRWWKSPRRGNGVPLSFSLRTQNLRKNLKPVGALPPSVKRIPSPGASWWPVVLNGKLDAEKIRMAGLEIYVVERPATSVNREIFLFAIDWAKGRGFFYLTTVPASPPSPNSR